MALKPRRDVDVLEAFLPQPGRLHLQRGSQRLTSPEEESGNYEPTTQVGLERGGVRGGEGFSRAVDLIVNREFLFFFCCMQAYWWVRNYDGWMESRCVFFFFVFELKRWSGRSLQAEVGGDSFFSVARCYDTGEAGHRSQTRWSQGRAGGGSLITVTSWYLPTARWQHRACTREEKRVGSSANLNQCPLFFCFFYSYIFLQRSAGVSPPGFTSCPNPSKSPAVFARQRLGLFLNFFSTRLDSTSVKFSSLYAASSGSQSAQKKNPTPNGNRTNHATKS